MCFFFVFTLVSWAQPAQPSQLGLSTNGEGYPRLPFYGAGYLTVAPDARTAAMGNAGVAIATDVNAVYWNAAGLVRMEDQYSASFSYTPWASQVANNMYMMNASVAQKLGKKSAIGLSFTYFNLGDYRFFSSGSQQPISVKPYDLSASLTYSYALSDKWSLGGSVKYLGNNYSYNNLARNSGDYSASWAVDIGALFQQEVSLLNNDSKLSLGAAVSNLGPKVEKTERVDMYLPARLALGAAFSTQFNLNHKLTLTTSASKLLIPTLPVSQYDQGNIVGIARGKDPTRGWFSGTFGSFTDAPDGFSEELSEIQLNLGMEYNFHKNYYFRAGYHHESEDKGDIKYLTLGLGFKYRMLNLDLGYTLFDDGLFSHPMNNTLRATLRLGLNGKKD
ncbi:type IX secretion system outer membrane channel protein PorV [Porifericola rhodea]|uniref:type IX secretion system outer membrane channel protein PorV n=1 Tax=Porifericola rhodea TaxID=930972 RepID=UPI0026653549|nr:type IX secretion system outer membrane channel protein PorV [Porifericola rhodea]WKN32852.1 type IX secretion system outer membrane channel protein PorV [Porifericola rhodea]